MSLAELRAAADTLGDLGNTAADDVIAWEKALKQQDSQVHRRAYVRAAFAAVEAISYGIRQYLLRVYEAGYVKFEWAEVAALAEVSPDVKANGSVGTRKFWPPQREALRMTFALTEKAFQRSLGLDFASPEWTTLEKAFAVRDRLVHPKKPSDYEISDPELSDIRFGMMWFLHANNKFFDASGDFLANRVPSQTGA
jgi:hypothetical protein